MIYIYKVKKPFYIENGKTKYKRNDIIMTYNNPEKNDKIIIFKATIECGKEHFPIAKPMLNFKKCLIPINVLSSCCERIKSIEKAFFSNLIGENNDEEVPKFYRKIESGIHSTSKEIENYMKK